MLIYTEHLTPDEITQAKVKFRGQKGMAKKRGIGFYFSFDEWINWWLATGHWHERGVGKGKYVMSRRNDSGDYTTENVFCQTFVQNFLDGTQKEMSTEQRAKISAAISSKLKGRVSPTKGTRHTDKTKSKISAAMSKYWQNKKNTLV